MCVEDERVSLGVVIVTGYGVCNVLARLEVSEEVRGVGCESWGKECCVHSGLS